MKKWYGNACLLITAIIWGFAFVAQTVGMDYVGPFTFVSARFFIGAATLLPLILWNRKKWKTTKTEETAGGKRTLLLGGLCCGVALCVASTLQQIGLQYTTTGKAGFITTLYVLFVPLLGLLLRRRIPRKIWLCVVLAAVGLYFLSMTGGSFSLSKGDAFCALCAFCFAIQILVVDYFSPKVNGVYLSALQFLVCGVIAAIPMMILEKPTLSALIGGAASILYAGILSSGCGYTLQIIGQRFAEPTTATLLMCLESVFSMVGGVLILHQIPTGRELFGAGLMFLAVILAQIPLNQLGRKKAKRT